MEQHFCIVTEFITGEGNKMSDKPGLHHASTRQQSRRANHGCLPGKYDIMFSSGHKETVVKKQKFAKHIIEITPNRLCLFISVGGLHHIIRGVREHSQPGMQAYPTRQARRVNHECFPPPLKIVDPCPSLLYFLFLHFYAKNAKENCVLLSEIYELPFLCSLFSDAYFLELEGIFAD